MCALVDIKANNDDLERSVKALYQEIKVGKGPSLDLRVLKDQKTINDTFASLNCLGIWIWHGGFSRISGKQKTV